VMQNAKNMPSFASAIPATTFGMVQEPLRNVQVMPSFVGVVPHFESPDAHVISAITTGVPGATGGGVPTFVSNAFHPLTFSMTSRPPPKWSGQATDWAEYRRGWLEHLSLLSSSGPVPEPMVFQRWLESLDPATSRMMRAKHA
jgi:hypothetical protein